MEKWKMDNQILIDLLTLTTTEMLWITAFMVPGLIFLFYDDFFR